MAEKIKSWRGRHVRIKEEYIVRRFNGYYNDEEEWVEDPSLPMIEEVSGCPLADFIDDPNEVFKVGSELYGVDLHTYRNREFEVGSVEPTHQIILIREGVNEYPYIWDAKYFDLLVRKQAWVKEGEQ